jgi:hypothetical protein
MFDDRAVVLRSETIAVRRGFGFATLKIYGNDENRDNDEYDRCNDELEIRKLELHCILLMLIKSATALH